MNKIEIFSFNPGMFERDIVNHSGYNACINQRQFHTQPLFPHGVVLSPPLSNILQDELDKELEARGHKFVRYADDFRIYCKSLKAAKRVNLGITMSIISSTKDYIFTETELPDQPNRLGT